MTKEEFLKKIKGPYPQRLDKNWDGSCPCCIFIGDIDGKEIGFSTDCWRASNTNDYQDLYVWGDLEIDELKEIANILKESLDNQKWYMKYKVYLNMTKDEYYEIQEGVL